MDPQAAETVYAFTSKTADGESLPLASLKGRVLLLVNVASICGDTRVNYEQLVELDARYAAKGLSVLVYPCNQFEKEEPWGDAEILKWAQQTHKVTFPVMAKGDVNGPSAQPLWLWLQRHPRFAARPKHAYSRGRFVPTGDVRDKSIEWNFAKFLISRQGVPLLRSMEDPLALEQHVVAALGDGDVAGDPA